MLVNSKILINLCLSNYEVNDGYYKSVSETQGEKSLRDVMRDDDGGNVSQSLDFTWKNCRQSPGRIFCRFQQSS